MARRPVARTLPEPAVAVRVAAVVVPPGGGPAWADGVAVAALGPMVAAAAAAGARLVVLPAAHVRVDEEGFDPALAEVRRWSRQGGAWLILGYRLTGPGACRRLLAVDPAGDIHAGCDLSDRPRIPWPSVAARFSADLRFAGWTPGSGLLAVPGGNGWLPTGARQRLEAWFAARHGAAAVCAAGPAGWVSDPAGRVLAACTTRGGPAVLVATVPVPGPAAHPGPRGPSRPNPRICGTGKAPRPQN